MREMRLIDLKKLAESIEIHIFNNLEARRQINGVELDEAQREQFEY